MDEGKRTPEEEGVTEGWKRDGVEGVGREGDKARDKVDEKKQTISPEADGQTRICYGSPSRQF